MPYVKSSIQDSLCTLSFTLMSDLLESSLKGQQNWPLNCKDGGFSKEPISFFGIPNPNIHHSIFSFNIYFSKKKQVLSQNHLGLSARQ